MLLRTAMKCKSEVHLKCNESVAVPGCVSMNKVSAFELRSINKCNFILGKENDLSRVTEFTNEQFTSLSFQNGPT